MRVLVIAASKHGATAEIAAAIGEGLGRRGITAVVKDVADVPDLRDFDAVLLALPLRPLCRPDCLGLCGVCGADLNTGSCPGHGEAAASPFTVLRDLLEP